MKTSISNFKNHPVVKNSAIYVVTDAINKAVPFLILPLLTHYLLPADYGIVVNYNVYINFLIIFIGINVQSVISVNFYRLQKSEVASYIFNVILATLITLLISSVVVLLFNKQLNDFLSVGTYYVIGGLLIAFSQVLSSINLTVWRLEERPIYFGGYQISQTVCDVGLSLMLIIGLNMSWEGRLIGIGGSAIIYALFSLILLWQRGYLRVSYNKNYIKDTFKFCIPLIPHTISIWARAGADRIIISTLVGASASGIYAAGFQFGLVISFLTLAFSNAYAPFVYKTLAITDHAVLENKKRKLVKFTYLYIVALLAITLFATLGSNFVVDNFLSAKYVNAKTYLVWALFSQAFQGIYLMYAGYIFFVKKSGQLAVVTFICSALQVALSYYLVNKVGPMGAAYSNFTISLLNCIVVMILSARVYPMPWFNFRVLLAK
ncbi:oligosaccharide flippase family protein [Dyadobacter chenwenxiniae]|uniref:Oligosaccharide flippase family protein n=1 Tax=Dyadobacter chenwenxiniae TaxID=2906456 RepID=A0A9X1PMI2_9BACT|nr:oligosaccharide flippase family protein [Dyadobacter chenwenxiniae]MCF0061296.1 oligosaccharide flippase family protein [Dyadobacter chenwenxiniae]UON81118.1 oligosaccharide flippase family protein [Dyadobacter chenwenxiniae]